MNYSVCNFQSYVFHIFYIGYNIKTVTCPDLVNH